MKNIIVLFCICTLIYGCSSDGKAEKQPKSPFAFAMPSHLYFKNMRSFHYEETTNQQQGLSVYRLKKLQNSASDIAFKPAIYVNWLEDEAYFVFEDQTNKIVDKMGILVVTNSTDTTAYELMNNDFASQQHFAINLIRKYQKSTIQQVELGGFSPILEDQSVRNQALIVIADYMKLIE